MSRSRTLRAAVAVALVAAASAAFLSWAATPGVPTGACTPGVGVGLVDVPTASAKDPRAQTYIIDHVNPGADFSRRFQICNGTAKAVPVQAYAGAANIDHGAFTIIEGRATNELSKWITVTPSVSTLAPGQRLIATAHFVVPRNAEPGERYAVLLAELPPQRTASGFNVAGRVGVRVYLDVSTGGAPKSDFTIDTLQAVRRADGTPAVLAQVHNTGGRALDLRGDLRLTKGPGGLNAGPFPAKLGSTLKPGDTEAVTVPLPAAITGGPWHAVIDLKSGLLERKAEGDITFPDKAATESPAVKAKALPLYKDRGVVGTVAGALIGVLLLLLLLFALREWLRRRNRDRP